MPGANVMSQNTIFRDGFAYAAHPHATITANGDILVVFNQTRRSRHILHPPHDPEYRNMLTRSSDLGGTWSVPEVVPGYAYSGTECAGLTTLSSGCILLNQWQTRWYPVTLARRQAPEPVQYPSDFVAELIASAELDTGGQIAAAAEAFAPWARGHGRCFVHASFDNGHSFTRTATIETGPFHGGYGLRGALELPDGRLLLPLNDIPEFRTIYTVASQDGGLSWQAPRLVARMEGRLFTEPAMIRAGDGTLVCMMRDDTSRIMQCCRSADLSETWSDVASTDIDGYPPHLLLLPDRRILCTYGVRQPESSIRAVLSEDHGRSWTSQAPVIIRGKLPNRDLGYPVTLPLPDGSLFTVYYCRDDAGVTGIEYTRWQL